MNAVIDRKQENVCQTGSTYVPAQWISAIRLPKGIGKHQKEWKWKQMIFII
jgi:hypothetical protein